MVKNPLIIIPARMASQRLAQKPLVLIKGEPMIVHTWRRAVEADFGPVVVACCGPEIAEVIENAGGKAIITDPNLPSGTDRIHAAASIIDPDKKHDAVINLQGDLPMMVAKDIAKSVKPLNNPDVHIGTLAALIHNETEIHTPSVVKIAVVGNLEDGDIGQALYFSRSPIPAQAQRYYHHIGIYAFRRDALERYVTLPTSRLEVIEKLEQLRALEDGMRIDVGLVETAPISIDTQDDLDRLMKSV